MKKFYLAPDLELIKINTKDILTTSPVDDPDPSLDDPDFKDGQ